MRVGHARCGGRGDLAHERNEQARDSQADGHDEKGVGEGLDLGFAVSDGPKLFQRGQMTVDKVATVDGGEVSAGLVEQL